MKVDAGKETFSTPFIFKTGWKNAFEDHDFLKDFSADILESYIVKKRWYGGKSSTLKYIEVQDYFRIASEHNNYYGVLLEVNYKEAFFQNYFMPIAFMAKEELDTSTVIAAVTLNGVDGYLVDALHQEDFRRLMYENIIRQAPSRDVKVKFHKGESMSGEKYVSSRFMDVEQSNTSIVYNDKYVLKIFRRIYIKRDVYPSNKVSREVV